MEKTTTPLENTEFTEEVTTPTELQDEQLIEETITDEKDGTLQETESTEEETIIEIDDPQYGRANGYLDSAFIGSQNFSTENEYIHADRYKHHQIYDGIDVSVHQGKINWSEVKQSGIDFAFIRAGFRGYGETGSLNIDDNFKTNITEALAAGIKVGVYFFSQAITEDEAVAEAEHILTLISDYEITLPVVIDFEYASTKDGLVGRLYNAGLSKKDATAICNRFCTIVENAGYSGMVYANKDMLENGLNADEIAKNHKIWLANYGTYSTYEGDYEFWQYTNTGSIDGIEGYVDRNFWYKEKEASYTNVSEGIYTISSCLNTSQVLVIS